MNDRGKGDGLQGVRMRGMCTAEKKKGRRKRERIKKFPDLGQENHPRKNIAGGGKKNVWPECCLEDRVCKGKGGGGKPKGKKNGSSFMA